MAGLDLLSLEFVDCRYLARHSKQWISFTARFENISEEIFLAVVRSDDRNTVSRVAKKTHEHKSLHQVLRLTQILIQDNIKHTRQDIKTPNLIEVRLRGRLAHAVVVANVNQLKFVGEPGIASTEARAVNYSREVGKILVPPVPQFSDGWTTATLCIQLDDWHAQTNKASEQRLIHVAVQRERNQLQFVINIHTCTSQMPCFG
jgi:hypothetical protein